MDFFKFKEDFLLKLKTKVFEAMFFSPGRRSASTEHGSRGEGDDVGDE